MKRKCLSAWRDAEGMCWIVWMEAGRVWLECGEFRLTAAGRRALN